ncbi:hypothetical protein BXY66_3876 [Shimia isoporae]|uniref:Uncharacterized protein n=1 Tax=Shimia isoporae TaxID=647720 RepID=A0A4R1N0Z5_9RHOB|nr:hypothetical protein [Shimia isoporae]TCK99374.1 hypothetical protein BXY66_3876 [Shimia isoporae]
MVRTYKPVQKTRRPCTICGRVFTAKRKDARYCGVPCRHRASRYQQDGNHQHRLKGEPDNPPETFAGCSFAEIDRDTAVPVLEQYEWLGDAGRADRFFASFTPDGRVMAVVGFATRWHRHNSDDGTILWCRGCTTPAAHKHAATWTAGRALKALKAEGAKRVIAYSDPLAGERGVVYSATGLTKAGEPHNRFRVRPPKVKWHEHHLCHSDRWLRHGGRNWSVEQARSKGYRVERVPQRQLWAKDL